VAPTDDRLSAFLPLVDGLAALLGDDCEVVLHDLSAMPETIVAIEHGGVTGRDIGDVPTDLMLRTLRRADGDSPSYRVYTSASKGRILRSLSVPLRDADGSVFGLLGVNFDVTSLTQAQASLAQLTGVASEDGVAVGAVDEIFSGDIREVLDGMLASILSEVGKSPAEMSREEKMAVVRRLEEQGAFLVKRSAEQIAAGLDLSRYTIFSYLKEIRREDPSQSVEEPSEEDAR